MDSEDKLIERLREVILRNDRQTMAEVWRVLDSREEMEARTGNIIQERIEQKAQFLKDNFEQEYGDTIDDLMERKIQSSKEEILNVIYPVLGQMIKKYIAYQFEQLQEAIERQIKNAKERLSPSNIFKRLRNRFSGVKESDLILSEAVQPIIEEVYVIQKESGLLLGSYYSGDRKDEQDVIAGMLTAIKAFAEDAFKKENQELETLEWGNFKIILQNNYSYYIAVVLTGAVSKPYRSQLSDKLNLFINKEMKGVHSKTPANAELYNRLTGALYNLFHTDKRIDHA